MHRRNVCAPAATTQFDIYDSAFRTLVSEISNKLINEKAVYYTSQLCHRYRSILEDSGVAPENQYQTKNLNKRLKDQFGSQIQIVFQRGKSSIVCASDVTVGEMCAFAAKLQDADANSEDSDQDTVKPPIIQIDTHSHEIAKHLYLEMKEHAKQERLTSRSDTDETISYKAASKQVPDDLFNHLAWMLFKDDTPAGEHGRVPLTESQEEKVLNIAQDVLLQVTGKPMPKHIGLALYILKQTGSKDLVRICNKFGQCISYDVAQRYITAWANEVESVGPSSFIPHGLVTGAFTYALLLS